MNWRCKKWKTLACKTSKSKVRVWNDASVLKTKTKSKTDHVKDQIQADWLFDNLRIVHKKVTAKVTGQKSSTLFEMFFKDFERGLYVWKQTRWITGCGITSMDTATKQFPGHYEHSWLLCLFVLSTWVNVFFLHPEIKKHLKGCYCGTPENIKTVVANKPMYPNSITNAVWFPRHLLQGRQ